MSAEEGQRTRKAKTITNLRTNIPWNNFSNSPSGCPASMECVLYGKRTFNLNYPQRSSFISSQSICVFLENCGADGFVKTGRNGRIFHSGGRGMLRVGIYKKNMLNIFSLPQMCRLFTDGELSDGFCCRTFL